jgi:hypothetical protein
MTPALSQLKNLDAEAAYLTRRIRDLKGVTAEFETALDRARHALDQHLCLIESDENALKMIRAQAVDVANHIGAEAYEIMPALSDLTASEQAEVGAILDDETPFEGVTDAGWETLFDAETEENQSAEVNAPEAEAEKMMEDQPSDTTIAQIAETEAITAAEKITAALAELANEPPETPDRSQEPEMTNAEVLDAEAQLSQIVRAYA